MKVPAALLLLAAGWTMSAAAGEYSPANRALVVFPGGKTHVSPYPMGRRAAAVWASDGCWRDCTSDAGWRFRACLRLDSPELCRDALDAADRACLRACRTKGGPLLNIAR